MKKRNQNQLALWILLPVSLFLFTLSFAQTPSDPPFKNEIQYFKKLDSALMPPKGKILMIGSSSFTHWKDVSYHLPGYPFINRGFGGSSITHLIYYFNDIVVPYKPRQILIYCGENDLSDNATAQMVVERFKKLFNMIRERDKKVWIAYISMKPSPSRIHLMDKMEDGNRAIEKWLANKKRASYVDVFSKMLDNDNKPLQEIFLQDKLHMNSKGYFIWAKAIKPYLLEN